MTTLTIDSTLCSQCGACVEVCQNNILELGNNDTEVKVNQEKLLRCIHCGHCEAVCPGGAIEMNYPEAGELPKISEGPIPGAEEMSRHIYMRRSIREFTDNPVPKEILEKMIETVHYAPSGMNGQTVHWLGIYEKEKVRALAESIIEWMRMAVETQLPHPFAFYFPIMVKAWDKGQDPICRNAPHLMIAFGPKDNPVSFVDSMVALSYLDLLAPTYGVGACWAGMVQIALSAAPELMESLGLPEGYKTQYAMMLGYPKYQYYRIPKRNKLVFSWK
jgi:nitroreductase/NAD-dependent dihydropyrimidine dehydrogenase PreA subunit